MRAREAPHGIGLILFGILLVVAGCAPVPPGREAGPPRAGSRDLAAIHLKGSPQFNGACLSCHAEVMKQTTPTPAIKEAHAVMVAQMPDYDEKAGVTNAGDGGQGPGDRGGGVRVDYGLFLFAAQTDSQTWRKVTQNCTRTRPCFGAKRGIDPAECSKCNPTPGGSTNAQWRKTPNTVLTMDVTL